MGALLAFPLLIVVLGVYNLIAFIDPGSLGEPAFGLTMVSGAALEPTWGDLVILAALMVLAIEVLKAARAGHGALVRHVLSLMVFAGALAEMLLVEEAATGIFFLLVAICLINLISGLAIALRPARRGVALQAGE